MIKKVVKKFFPACLLNFYNMLKNQTYKKINIYKIKICKNKIVDPKKVSVIIPNYNYAKYIEQRIDSVLYQTYPIYEIIILDDGSTDGSVEIINDKIKTIDNVRVKLVVNNTNSGSVFAQWENGLKISEGDYVWIAEADDICSPYFLENAMEGFSDEKVVLSYTESILIDENNKVIQPVSFVPTYFANNGIYNHNFWKRNYVEDGIKEIKRCLCICCTIPNVSAVVWKKVNFLSVVKKSINFKQVGGDWFAYYNILKSGKIAFSKKNLNYFRRHSGSASHKEKNNVILSDILTIQKEIRDNFELGSNELALQKDYYSRFMEGVDEETIEKLKEKFVE